MYKIISCFNRKWVIGNEGKPMYTIKNDIKNFESQTKYDGVVIMGRVTFESLPNGKPLPGRVNIVITSNESWCTDPDENLFIVHSIEDARELCETVFPDKEWFVIGGESVYRQFINEGCVDEMRITVVNDDADGDAFFPPFNENEWYVYYKSMRQKSVFKGSEKSFNFFVLRRKP